VDRSRRSGKKSKEEGINVTATRGG
jgi:hypothetical protein